MYLSGSFNSWSTERTPLQACDSGWVVLVKLKPGKYSYKYILDGRWTQDPFNKLTEQNSFGAYNSVVYCYNYTFRLRGFTSAHQVILAGNFNNWNEKELKMIHIDGSWLLSVYLKDGTYTYKFIVDGIWIRASDNKLSSLDGKGGFNSIIGIGDSVLFRLKGFRDAKNVVLTGSFNGWNTIELLMDKTKDGWQKYYVLGHGNYEYKFIVDGKWIVDAGNEQWEDNEFGTGNSVLWIEP